MDYDWTDVVYLLAALALPVAALARRKLHWRTGVLMALAWIGIFGVVALFISAVRG
jgi:hypothetical protein